MSAVFSSSQPARNAEDLNASAAALMHAFDAAQADLRERPTLDSPILIHQLDLARRASLASIDEGAEIIGLVSRGEILEATRHIEPRQRRIKEARARISAIVLSVGHAQETALMSQVRDGDALQRTMITVLAIFGITIIALVIWGQHVSRELVAARRLEKSEERFDLAARATQDVIWDWDVRTGKVWTNAALRAGWDRIHIASVDDFLAAVHPDDAESTKQSLYAALAGDDELWSHEYRIARTAGQYASVLDRGYIVRDANGVPLRVIGAAMDVSRIKDAERALAEMSRQNELILRAAAEGIFGVDHEGNAIIGAVVTFRDITERRAIEKMKDEFISVVSHELRTPLTAIRGALGLLSGGIAEGLPVKAQRMFAIASSNAERLIRLINDILDIERLESGGVLLRQRTVAADLITQAVEIVRPIADKAGVALEIAATDEAVSVVPDRIVQTLTNLVNNAVKFSHEGTAVTISATVAGTDVRFDVVDRGRGIPKDKQEMIFERFQQIDSSDCREKGGTGLGLAICRGIVTQHGGTIWVESEPGQGSRFSFTVPRSVARVA